MKKMALTAISLLFLIKNAPINAQSVAELTRQITEGKTTDSLKIEAIYDWLTRNIRYDDDARKRQSAGDTVLRQEPYNVVAFRRAMCMGYAKTLREMCRISGIEAYVVEGIGKSADHLGSEGHAWNVVKMGNNWRLLDATWDAGTPVFAKKYFLTDPSVFIATHWPQDPMWQLLNAPVSLDCFKQKVSCERNAPTLSAFNFSDTIRLWQSLDSSQQLYNQLIRMIDADSNNRMALYNLAEFYYNISKKTLEEYNEIRLNVTNKKRSPNGKTAVLQLLATSIDHLKSAQSAYQTLANKSKNKGLNDAYLNVQLIEDVLNNLAAEQAFVVRYFKD